MASNHSTTLPFCLLLKQTTYQIHKKVFWAIKRILTKSDLNSLSLFLCSNSSNFHDFMVMSIISCCEGNVVFTGFSSSCFKDLEIDFLDCGENVCHWFEYQQWYPHQWWRDHCVKSVQIRKFFWSVFSCIRTGPQW